MNNLDLVVTTKEIKIPESVNTDFKICISSWKDSIEIRINIEKDIYMDNLFFIFKSYINNSIVPCNKIAIGWLSYEDSFTIVEVLNIYKFKKISFVDFCDWYEWRIQEGYTNNSQQNRKEEVLYFLFIFEKKILELKKINLKYLKPNYPWKDSTLIYELNEVNFLKNKIKRLEGIIKKFNNK